MAVSGWPGRPIVGTRDVIWLVVAGLCRDGAIFLTCQMVQHQREQKSLADGGEAGGGRVVSFTRGAKTRGVSQSSRNTRSPRSERRRIISRG